MRHGQSHTAELGKVPPDLEVTLGAVSARGWRLVLLGSRSKRPRGVTWTITSDLREIRRHVLAGGNAGLVCGPESGVAVLDFDDLDAAGEMMAGLGRLPPTALTGSGKGHVYIRHEPGLPAKIRWRDTVVGEIQRGGVGPDGSPVLQQVVIPPSWHPSGGRYRWLADPRASLLSLPEPWRVHLASASPPVRSVVASRRPVSRDASALLAAALRSPGARWRGGDIKFQCPGCLAEGHDRHRDNARLFANGRWGCALDPSHWRVIGEALGALAFGARVQEAQSWL
jgi:hypothetical protein